jgi:cell division septum initiation protein DivIVA
MTKQDQYKKLKRQSEDLEQGLPKMEKELKEFPSITRKQKISDAKTTLGLIHQEMDKLVMGFSNYEFYKFVL